MFERSTVCSRRHSICDHCGGSGFPGTHLFQSRHRSSRRSLRGDEQPSIARSFRYSPALGPSSKKSTSISPPTKATFAAGEALSRKTKIPLRRAPSPVSAKPWAHRHLLPQRCPEQLFHASDSLNEIPDCMEALIHLRVANTCKCRVPLAHQQKGLFSGWVVLSS